MSNPVGLPDKKVGYRTLLSLFLALPPEEGLKKLQVLRECCEHAKRYAGKPSPYIPDALPFAEDGWDDGSALLNALEKTIF